MSKKEDFVSYLYSYYDLSFVYTTIWQCGPWFGPAWSGSERSGLVCSFSVFHTRI